jgi:hypothetical protein
VAASRAFAEKQKRVAVSETLAGRLDRLARRARDVSHAHHGFIGRQAAVLRHLDRAETQTREASLAAGEHFGPGKRRQSAGKRLTVRSLQQDFEKIRVRVRKMIREDNDGLAGDSVNVFHPEQR